MGSPAVSGGASSATGEQLALALVPVGFETLAIFVLAHLLTTLFDQRTHVGKPLT